MHLSFDVSVFLQVKASDNDTGVNAQLAYSVVYTNIHNFTWFTVDNITGRVYNVDTINTYQQLVVILVIQAEDQAQIESERRNV